MTTNIDRAAEVMLATERKEQGHVCDVDPQRLREYARALADAGLLTGLPAPVAQTFPVGEFIDDERRARGWSHADLAEALGVPVRGVHELIDGRGRVTANIAERLGRAFGTSAQYWSIMQKTHDKEGK